jgi:hypothetical protein
MTASPSTISPDPLAPASAPVAPTESKPAAEKVPEQPSPKKRSAGLLIALASVGLLLLIGGGVAAFLFLPKSASAPVTNAPPVPPDPGTPPPPPQFDLAQTKASARGTSPQQEHAEAIAAAAKRLQARMFVGSGETAAPREFIVRGGGASDAAGLQIPNHERWEIQFPPGLTIEAYTRQLDFFKIELGVIGGSQTVTYLSGLSNPKPRVRTAPGNTDARLYLIWNRGPLREADEILVARAGLNAEGKVLAHFCPPELEAEMLRVEAEQARTNNLTNLRRTVFGIQPVAADTFRLVVTDQKGD